MNTRRYSHRKFSAWRLCFYSISKLNIGSNSDTVQFIAVNTFIQKALKTHPGSNQRTCCQNQLQPTTQSLDLSLITDLQVLNWHFNSLFRRSDFFLKFHYLFSPLGRNLWIFGWGLLQALFLTYSCILHLCFRLYTKIISFTWLDSTESNFTSKSKYFSIMVISIPVIISYCRQKLSTFLYPFQYPSFNYLYTAYLLDPLCLPFSLIT